jgi:hypothetical protein
MKTLLEDPKARTSRSGPAAVRPYDPIVSQLPFIDEHRVRVRAPLARTWDAVMTCHGVVGWGARGFSG